MTDLHTVEGEGRPAAEVMYDLMCTKVNSQMGCTVGSQTPNFSTYRPIYITHTENNIFVIYSVSCYPSGHKIGLIPSISEKTVTNMVSMHAVYKAPSYDPRLILLTRFPIFWAYFNMLFIFGIACTAGHCENQGSNVRQSS